MTLNNSLFGIPASHVTFEMPASGGADMAAAADEQCEVPLEERLAREQQQQPDGGVPSSALAVFQPQRLDKAAQGSQAGAAQQCKPADAETCAATTLLGVYTVQHGSRDLMLLPPAKNSSAGGEQPDGATGRYRFLLLLASAAVGGAASVVVVALAARRRTTPAMDVQHVQQVQQPQQLQTAAVKETPGSRARRRGSASGKRQQQQQQQMSNRLKGLVQQAASDGAGQSAADDAGQAHLEGIPVAQPPPQQDDGLPSSAAVAAGLMDPAMRRREMQDGVILIGRMRVSMCLCRLRLLGLVAACLLWW